MKSILIICTLFLVACVSKNQYRQLEQENKKVLENVKTLNKELGKLKNENKLLSDSSKKLLDTLEYYQTELKVAKKNLIENLEVMMKKTGYKYPELHTALDVIDLTWEEKNVFYYLNLARNKPQYFAQTYLKNNKILYNYLMKMSPVEPVEPFIKVSNVIKSIYSSGIAGMSASDSIARKKILLGEKINLEMSKEEKEKNRKKNCDDFRDSLYKDEELVFIHQFDKGLDIVIKLLSGQFRDIFLSKDIKFIGVNIVPKKVCQYVAIISYNNTSDK